jgi:hypothetical protein
MPRTNQMQQRLLYFSEGVGCDGWSQMANLEAH